MSSIAEKFDLIYQHYGFGHYPETRSGHGSLLESTVKIREGIVKLILQKNIKSLTDFPCGDFNWIKEIVHYFDRYVGCDISKTCIEDNKKKYPKFDFRCLNLIEDEIPENELILVRDVLGHLPLQDGKKIIDNIINSNIKYLLTTTFVKKTGEGWESVKEDELPRMNENLNDYGLFYPINLMEPPFNFPLAETYIEEDVEVINYHNGVRKALGFWSLDKLRKQENTDEKGESLEKLLNIIKTSNNPIFINHLTVNL